MLISFTGAQSTGKTTLLNALKDNILLSRFNFVDEITRNIQKEGFKINEDGNDDTQAIIMRTHLRNTEFKRAILDRCALDGLVYTYYLFKKKKVSANAVANAEEIFKKCISKYDIIFYTKPEFKIVKDGVRSNSKKFRRDIDKLFKKTIKSFNLNVVVLKGSVKERLNTIYKVLRENNIVC